MSRSARRRSRPGCGTRVMRPSQPGICHRSSWSRTKVVSSALFHTAAERDGMLHSGMAGGATHSYEALDRVLSALA